MRTLEEESRAKRKMTKPDVAAPALYEALQFINEHISFSAVGGGANVVDEARRMMESALAAAGGESEVAK